MVVVVVVVVVVVGQIVPHRVSDYLVCVGGGEGHVSSAQRKGRA